MVELVVEVPEISEKRMERFDWVDWSWVVSNKIKELEEFELEKKIAEISEISPDDKREVKESVFREFIESCEETKKGIKSGKIKPMNREEFNKWCDEL